MDKFDFTAPAELFRSKTRGGSSFYRRFDSAADAISFAVEGQVERDARMTVLEVEDARLDSRAIRQLYDSTDYPLERKSR